MNRKIKLIWDFKGMDAQQTAAHHRIHIEEFILKEKIALNETGIEHLNDMHWIAYMNVPESDVFKIRDALLPHRAEVI